MQRLSLPRNGRFALVIVLFVHAAVLAEFVPIALTPESYSHDVVVEKGAPPPLLPVTTASLETGVTNIGLGWYERGYYADWPATGLPQAGAVIQAEYSDGHDFQFAPSYQASNALLLDNQVASGTLTLTSPRACAALSFLACSAAGPVSVGFTVYHQDGATQEGAFSPPSWNDGAMPAWTSYGRVDVRKFTFSGVNAPGGRLFPIDVTISNSLSPILRIECRFIAGEGHAAIFALSAAEAAGGPFAPVTIEGYNHDLVVEASALHPGYLAVTTATLEAGSENRLYTFYEQGYVSALPGSGLPAAGAVLTPASFPGSSFALAPDYAGNNAAVLDSGCQTATLVPATAACYSGLVLLTSASHGPVTNTCAIHHADDSWETNIWVADDYLEGSSPVFVANGRVDTGTRVVDRLGEARVRLFAAPCGVRNARSPITELVLDFGGEQGSACTVIALSGILPGPSRPVLSFQPHADGGFTLTTTADGDLESAASPDAPAGSWRSEGPVIGSVRIYPSANEPWRFYRVRVN